MAEGARLAGSVFGEPLLGTLAPGAPADICVLAYPVPAPLHGDNLAGHWVFGLAPGRVRDVYVAGELVVAEGRSTRVDEAMVAASGVRITQELWRRLEGIPPREYALSRKDDR
jgi:cytosine/adenosine deaminase-related metal-dependent hydrolase